MIRIFLLIIFFSNDLLGQSLLDRFIVPVYIESEISSGYDNNYLKLSSSEKNSPDLYSILGDSQIIDSKIIKNKFNILYIPYILHRHETQFQFKISNSYYASSKLKSYNSYYFKMSQHLAAYTWLKLSYSYTPSFYLKCYVQSDAHILNDLAEDSYMPSLFSSEKVGVELSMPIPYINRAYMLVRYLHEFQYYNSDFTEFDLDIANYYVKIRKKILNYFGISIAHMMSDANNISYLNGLVSTANKDRSYKQSITFLSLSAQKFSLLGTKTSVGITQSMENRTFSSTIQSDVLHFGREHSDLKLNLWVKSYVSNNFAIKFKSIYRRRDTISSSEYVKDLKSFEKFEFWLSVILKLDVNVY